MNLSRCFSKLVFPLFCILFLATSAHAQFKATVQGTILDPTGGAVPGAKVTILNQDTGLSRESTASAEGFYHIAELAPGKYTVIVEAPGFKSATLKDIMVLAEQSRGLDVTLQVGDVSDKVTVTASDEVLQTQDANISSTISSEQIQRLPQFGRDPYELLRLAPGVFGDGARAGNGTAANLPNSGGPGGSNNSIFSVENQVQVTANGQRNSGNNFTIDGTSVNSLTWGGAAILTPNQESIQEVTIVANTYSAEDGRNTGAQVKVVSKNGTNQFHGSGFFKVDSPGMNAFNRWGGPDGQAPEKVEQNLRQFGGSIGGPIKKDKMFFFFSYEGDRNSDTSFSGGQYVETTALQQWMATNRAGTVVGDLITAKGFQPRISQVLTPSCNDFNSVGYGSATQCQVVSGGVDVGSPALGGCTMSYGQYADFFNGNTTACGLDGVADLQKVITVAPSRSSGNQYNARVDFTPRMSDQFTVSFYVTPLNSLAGDLGANGRPMADLTFNPRNKYVALIWNHTFSPTLTNEARTNWTRFFANQFDTNPDVAWNLPRWEVEQVPGDRIKYGANQGTNSPGVFAQNQFDFRDTLSKVLGRHALKAGVSVTINQDNNDYEFGSARPVYVAHGLWNFVDGTPIFEGIDINPRTGAPTDVHKYYRQRDFSLFVQDDIKVRPNFTLNVGLRYEYFAPLNEKDGNQSNLVLGSGPNPLQTANLKVGGSLYPADKNNFAPRLGFAWTPSKYLSKTVIRGGFGVAYNRITDTMTGISRVNPPFLFREGLCCAMSSADFAANPWGAPPFDNGLIVVAEGASNNPLSWPANPALAATFDPSTGLPLAGTVEIWGAPQTNRTPYTYLYSMEVQHQLPGRMIFTAGYQGSESRKMLRIVNLNNVYPQLNAVLSPVFFPTTDVNGHYNALNLSVNKAPTHGLSFFGKYQLSRSIDGGSWEGAGGNRDPFYPPNRTFDYGPSDFDVTHNMLITALYELPFFRGHNDWTGRILGGWQINGTYQFHTGFPWSPVESNQCPPIPAGGTICPSLPAAYLGGAKNDHSTDTLKSTNGDFPGIVPGGNCNSASGPVAGQPYFDVCTQGPPFIHRNGFRGPRYQTFDMSFVKSTSFPFFHNESARLELRANAFNLFNKLNLIPFGRNTNNVSINDTHFGQASGALAGRVVEFQTRLVF